MTTKLTWVLGAIALCALAWFVAGSRPAHALSNCDVTDSSNDAVEQEFLRLLNAYRATKGAPALTVSAGLNRSATWMATDLGQRPALAHQDSLGRTPWVRMPDCGYGIPGGENLAAGLSYESASAALNAWKGSPSHNNVMLEPEFTEVGIARVYTEGSRYGYYWVTNFGYGSGSTEQATATATPIPPTPVPTRPPVVAKPAAPPPPPPTATPTEAPSQVTLKPGPAHFSWNGPKIAPAQAFAPVASSLAVVYAWDPWTSQWLRWSPQMEPELQTLQELVPGGQYWVIARASLVLPLK